MPSKLTGVGPSLAYTGVNAPTPPNITESNGATARAPTINDYNEFTEGDLWMVKRAVGATVPNELWYLARKTGTVSGPEAHWRQLFPGAGGGGGGNLRSEDLLIEIPDPGTGAINVYGGEPFIPDPMHDYVNIYTKQLDPYTLAVCLTRTINQPNTNVTGTEGMYQLGGLDFLHNYGTSNTACGHGTLNLTLTVLNATDNSAFGTNSLHNVSTGVANTGFGSGSLSAINSGSVNIGLGVDAGASLDGTAHSNIMIGNAGLAADINTIRIGVQGALLGQQNQVLVAGIWNGPAVPVVNTGIVIVDDQGQLYADDVAADSVLFTDAGGNLVGRKGAIGTVLTGHGAAPADPVPEFLPITSPDLSVIVGVEPITGGITLTAAPAGGGIATVTTGDTLIVVPDAGHNINFADGELINTTGAIANTVTFNLDRGLTGQVVSGTGVGSASIYKTLFSPDGSIVFDYVTDPTAIHMTAPGGGGGGITNLTADSGVPALPFGGAVNVAGGLNIRTVGSNPPGVITVHVTDDVDLAGHLYATTDIKTSTGHLITDLGSLYIQQNTTIAGNAAIYFGGDKFIHNYGVNNTFLGKRSGNLTMNPATCTANSGYGMVCLEKLTSGTYNTAGGWLSQGLNQNGHYNTSLGADSLGNLLSGSYNSIFGYQSGSAYVAGEHSNLVLRNVGVAGDVHTIRIGTEGTSDGQQNKCYVAGVWQKLTSAGPEMVIVDSDGKLGSRTIPSGGGGTTTFVTNSGTATEVGGTINVLGADNINTTAAGNTVTVHLDKSVIQPFTTSSGAQGCYSLGVTNYATDRFLHAYGTSSTYVGRQAGPITGIGGTSCVGIGTNALDAAAGATSCVAIGRNALTAAVTSKNVTAVGNGAGAAVTSPPGAFFGEGIYIGSGAGNLYTTQYFNITMGNAATSSDTPTETRTMRLGYKNIWTTPAPSPHDPDPVETETNPTDCTQSTYLYGVYRKPVAYSGTPVYVDHLGKLGTDGGAMFAFRQTTTLSSVTGDGTIYVFGTSGGITVDFDNTSSLSSFGAGAAIVFTAPYAGKYVLGGSITLSVPASPPIPRVVSVEPLYIVTDNLSYTFTAYLPASTTFVQYVSEIVNTVVYLDAGQHVYWACKAGAVGLVKNISIQNRLLENFPAPISAPVNCYATYFYGYRVS